MQMRIKAVYIIVALIVLAVGWQFFWSSSQKDLGGGYSTDGINVYVANTNISGHASGKTKLQDADPQTFVLVGRRYGKDKNHAYYPTSKGTPIAGADAATFEAINDFYAKDKNAAYYGGSKISDADNATFDVFSQDSWNSNSCTKAFYAKDQKRIYYGGVAIAETDRESFFILPGQGGSTACFAKDNNAVFYGGNKVENSDPTTFMYMNEFYTKDKNSVYHTGHYQVDWCIDGSREPKTGPKVCVIKGADPATFKIIDPEQQCGPNCYFDAQDKNHKYRKGLMIN